MPHSYEARLNPALAASFQVVFERVMRQAKFDNVLDLSPTSSLHVWEFRRSLDLVAMTITSEGEKERLHIESETVDIAPFVLKTVLMLAKELLEASLGLLDKLEDAAVKERVRAWYRETRELSEGL